LTILEDPKAIHSSETKESFSVKRGSRIKGGETLPIDRCERNNKDINCVDKGTWKIPKSEERTMQTKRKCFAGLKNATGNGKKDRWAKRSREMDESN